VGQRADLDRWSCSISTDFVEMAALIQKWTSKHDNSSSSRRVCTVEVVVLQVEFILSAGIQDGMISCTVLPLGQTCRMRCDVEGVFIWEIDPQQQRLRCRSRKFEPAVRLLRVFLLSNKANSKVKIILPMKVDRGNHSVA
jgi:hypothetical protein